MSFYCRTIKFTKSAGVTLFDATDSTLIPSTPKFIIVSIRISGSSGANSIAFSDGTNHRYMLDTGTKSSLGTGLGSNYSFNSWLSNGVRLGCGTDAADIVITFLGGTDITNTHFEYVTDMDSQSVSSGFEPNLIFALTNNYSAVGEHPTGAYYSYGWWGGGTRYGSITASGNNNNTERKYLSDAYILAQSLSESLSYGLTIQPYSTSYTINSTLGDAGTDRGAFWALRIINTSIGQSTLQFTATGDHDDNSLTFQPEAGIIAAMDGTAVNGFSGYHAGFGGFHFADAGASIQSSGSDSTIDIVEAVNADAINIDSSPRVQVKSRLSNGIRYDVIGESDNYAVVLYFRGYPTSIGGSTTLTFGQDDATLTKRVAISGTSSLSFDQSGTVVAKVKATGTAELQFDSVSFLMIKKLITAALDWTIWSVGSADRTGLAELPASSGSLTFTQTGSLRGKADRDGAAAFTFGQTGALRAIGVLAGTAQLSFTDSVDLEPRIAIDGTSTVTFTPTSTILGGAFIGANTGVSFTGSGTLVAELDLVGSANINFGAELTTWRIAGDSNLTFTESATILPKLRLSGNSGIIIGEDATLTSRKNGIGSSSLVFFAELVNSIFGETGFSFSTTANLAGKAELAGSTRFRFIVYPADIVKPDCDSSFTPSPAIGTRTTVRFQWPYSSVVAYVEWRKPEFGNTFSHQLNRLVRNDWNNDIQILQPSTWPTNLTIVNLRFANLTYDEKEGMKSLLDLAKGDALKMIDWYNRTWKGVIRSFNATQANVAWDVELEFFGSLQ